MGPKVLIDTANELDFSKGRSPALLASQTRCVAENIQNAFPNLKVVKSLNTITANVMVSPRAVKGGDHTIFVAGNDKDAKARVGEILRSFGWSDILRPGRYLLGPRSRDVLCPVGAIVGRAPGRHVQHQGAAPVVTRFHHQKCHECAGT